MKVSPLFNYLLIKPVEKQQVLVSDDGTLNEYGEVIAIGPEVLHIKVGDRVGFSVFGVEKLVIDEQKYYFVRESGEFLLAKIED